MQKYDLLLRDELTPKIQGFPTLQLPTNLHAICSINSIAVLSQIVTNTKKKENIIQCCFFCEISVQSCCLRPFPLASQVQLNRFSRERYKMLILQLFVSVAVMYATPMGDLSGLGRSRKEELFNDKANVIILVTVRGVLRA